MQTTTAILLAAGQGTRMKSALPKVMHRVCGLPIVHFGVRAALDAGCGEVVVVVGHGRQLVEEYLERAFPKERVRTVVQEEQRGTGDAARVGLAVVRSDMVRALILNGDVPLLEAITCWLSRVRSTTQLRRRLFRSRPASSTIPAATGASCGRRGASWRSASTAICGAMASEPSAKSTRGSTRPTWSF